MPTKSGRAYKRLDVKSWGEIEAYWRAGCHTLEDLAAEYGVTTRALQSHFKNHHVMKGEHAASIKASAESAIEASEVDDQAGRLRAYRAARARTASNANKLEAMLMSQVSVAEHKPEEAFRALATIKSLAAAAQALERLQIIRRAALGIETEQTDELPEIHFTDLTERDLTELQDSCEQDDGEDDPAPEEENEVLTYA